MEWLTLDQLAGVLRLPRSYVKELTKQGFLVSIGRSDKTRWLNPTEEYREKLRLAAVLHNEKMYVPKDVAEIALLTLREVAILLGWSHRYSQIYMQNHPEIQRYKINSQLSLYPIQVVRDLLWRRQDRKLAHQLAPHLITELIDFVRREHAEETELIPTDEQYKADDLIQRKLEQIVRRSEADQAKAKCDLARKAVLARKIVQILESGSKPSAQQ